MAIRRNKLAHENNISDIIDGKDAKTTPHNDDVVGLVDSEASSVLKKLSWSNIKATLKTYFDTLYQGILTEGAFVDGDKTKLDTIEESADVTDTTNVTNAGALMDSEVTNLADVKSFDPADYATATQGSTADSAVQPTGTPVDNDFAKFTDGNTVEGRSYSEVLGDLGLGTGDSPQFTGIELGHATDTTLTRKEAGEVNIEGKQVITEDNTVTMTNKRITDRVASTANSATATIDCDSYDEYYLTAMSAATTISVTGTPTNGQSLFIGLKDDGTTRALTWTGITGLGVTLPTDTTAGKQHIIGLKYIASAWRAIAVGEEE